MSEVEYSTGAWWGGFSDANGRPFRLKLGQWPRSAAGRARAWERAASISAGMAALPGSATQPDPDARNVPRAGLDTSDKDATSTIYAFADAAGVFYVGKRRGSQQEREAAGYNIAVWHRRKREHCHCLTLAVVPTIDEDAAESRWLCFFANLGCSLLNVVGTPGVAADPRDWYAGLDLQAIRQRALDEGCTLSRGGNYVRPPPALPPWEGELDRLPGVEADEPWSEAEQDELLAEMRYAFPDLGWDDLCDDHRD